ncbi:coiled-coil domain-containing protein 40-like [Gouania willdenowi]|uniref:Coiled-coil domain-containing protein 40-like n=1 Tax=Gouania willdenowi TaxID=441366 RepID=A0A8C5E6T9_GOUWI|nr:coiled-coil domain-containing protein 40-like [Gouania willdenowi]
MKSNSNSFHGRSVEIQTHPLVSSPSIDNIGVAEHAAQEQLMMNISITTVDMKDEDPKQGNKEEDLLVLDHNHQLVLKHQTALTHELGKQLEQMQFELKEKTKIQKEDARYSLKLKSELQKEQANQVRLQKKLQDLTTAQVQTVVKHNQVQEQLEVNTKQSSEYSEKKCKAEHSVSQFQAELDNLMLLSLYTKKDFEEVHSQLKTMKHVRNKEQAEKSQAEKEKQKQDLYVNVITKDLDRLRQQKDMHLCKIIALKEETRASNKSLSKINMDMELLLMTRKQLLCQWNNSLLEMQKRDEPFSAKQEAVFKDRQQLILLDEEIDKYNKSIKAIEEQNQTMITELEWYRTDCAAFTKRISEKRSQQKALQSRYREHEHLLEQTSKSLVVLKMNISTQQAELNNYSKKMDKISSIRQELENKIITHMEQQLPHKNKDEHSLIKKTTSLKTEKQSLLQHQESNITEIKLASHNANVLVGTLELTQQDLEEEIRQLNKHLTIIRTDILSHMKLLKQKQGTITDYKNKINKIVVSMANEDMSPLERKLHTITAQMNALEVTLGQDKQMWMELQETAVRNMLKMEAYTREIFTLQTENHAMLHKKMRLESQVEFEHQAETEMEKTCKSLHQDKLKLNTLLSKNKVFNQEMEEENELMETEFNQKLKEAYWETLNLQIKKENIEEENEQIMESLMQAEEHIMFWERKAQIVQETQAVVDSETNKDKISMMNAEIRRKEIQLSGLMKQQKELVSESEKVVERWGSNIQKRKMKPRNSSKMQATKTAISRLQRSIKEAQKLVGDSVTTINELQEVQTSLSNSLMQRKQQVTKLTNTSSILDSAILKLQHSKDWEAESVRTLLSRERKLREVMDKRYKVSSTSQCVEAALENLTKHLHKVGTISHRVCEEFPLHQEALHRLNLELAPHIQQ